MPLPNTTMRASELGCKLQCDLMTGLDKISGGAATDYGPLISAWLAGATAARPLTLIVDGSFCVSGLFLPAGGHWSIVGDGWDTGFFQKAATNNDVIHNGNSTANVPSDPGGVAPTRGANVSIRNLFINGNRGNGTNGNSTSGDPRGLPSGGDLWYFGINLMNLDHVLIEHVRFFNTSAYNLRLSNVGDWIVDGCHFENVLPTDVVSAQNSDGVHVNGPSNDGRISNCFFRTGDDAIAFNGPEGSNGLIARMTVANCVALQAQTMMRIYAGSLAGSGGSQTAGVDGLTVVNYQGSANVVGFIFGVEIARTMTVADAITNVSLSNCKVAAPGFAWIQDNIGTLSFDNCDWIGGTRAEGMIVGTTVASLVTFINVANCRLVRTTAGHAGAALFDNQNIFGAGAPGITYGKAVVNGFQRVDAAGYSGSPLAGLTQGAVTIGTSQTALIGL